jgi:uncharacterized protein (TIGR04255 family)
MTDEDVPLPVVPERHYERPPLVEALCEIHFTGSSWDATIPGLFYERVRGEYPKKLQLEMGGIEVQILPGQTQTRQFTPEPRVRFSREDESRLVQVARDLLVVNQLRPYTHFEDWRAVVHATLRLYRELAAPVGIARLAVRYINLIPVSSASIRMKDFFRIYATIPEELGGDHGPFLLHLVMLPVCRNHQLTITLGTNPAASAEAPSILLDLYDVVSLAGRDAFTELQRLLDEAHANIVHTFENTITDAARTLFGETAHD